VTDIRLRNHLDELPRLESEIDAFAAAQRIGGEACKALQLVLEELVRELSGAETASADDAGLRILGHLAKEIRHEQFHDRNFLFVAVDSKPL